MAKASRFRVELLRSPAIAFLAIACEVAVVDDFPSPGDDAGSGLDASGTLDANALDGEPLDGEPLDGEPSWPPPWDGSAPFTCNLLEGGVDAASPHTPTNSAGTRLHPRYAILDDGTKLLYDVLDVELGTTCTITAASDGKFRCLPTQKPTMHESFTDSACTAAVAVARTGPGCNAPMYIGASSYRKLGAKLSPVGRWDKLADGTCVPVPIDGFDDYAIGASVPLTTFAAFSTELEAIVSGLEAVVHVGPDGSRIWRGEVRDTEHGVDVQMNGQFLPRVEAEQIPNCCSPNAPGECPSILDGGQESCTAPSYWADGGAPLVTTRYMNAVFRVGAPISTLRCGTNTDAGCLASASASSDRWRAEESVDRGCFFPYAARSFGSGRLKSSGWETMGVSLPLLHGSLSTAGDAVLDDAFFPLRGQIRDPDNAETYGHSLCTLLRLGDGKVHCVAGSIHPGPLFADPACTDEVGHGNSLTLKGGSAECRLDQPQTVAYSTVLPPLNRPDVPYYTRDAYGQCTVVYNTRRVELGPEIAPSEFPEVTIGE